MFILVDRNTYQPLTAFSKKTSITNFNVETVLVAANRGTGNHGLFSLSLRRCLQKEATAKAAGGKTKPPAEKP